MTPKRIQLRRTAGWRKPEGAVVVSRPSRWGNPWWIYNGHTLAGPPWSMARDSWRHIPASERTAAYVTSSHMSIQRAVDQYRDLLKIRARDESERLREWLAPLVGRDLACWCPLDQPCHADVLLEIANGGRHG